MAYNICYSTIIPGYRLKDYKEDQYAATPNGDYFINSSMRVGVLPEILDHLIT